MGCAASRRGATVVSARLERFVRHAELFGGDCVDETAREVWASELRDCLPQPRDLTWMAPLARELLLDERERAFADYRAECRQAVENLRRLRIELDAIERGRKGPGGKFTVGKSRRRFNGESVAAARALRLDGLTTNEIRVKLGVSFKHAQRLLASGAK